MKLTLGEAKAMPELYHAAVANLDSQDNIDAFVEYLNLAQERLINSGKWVGTKRVVRFATPSSFITLPRRYVSALAAKYLKDGWATAAKINNEWYQYLPGAANVENPALWPAYAYNRNLDDLGDGWVTYQDVPAGNNFTLSFTGNAADNGKVILVQGLDASGNEVFTQSGGTAINGVKYTLGSAQSSQVFSKITLVQKPQTQYYVTLTGTYGTTSLTLGYYEPTETNISYRRYAVYTSVDQDYCDVICKLRYVPARVDSDEIIPANVGALRKTIQAIKYEENGDGDRYTQFFGDALVMLNSEQRESDGGATFRLNISPEAYRFAGLWPGY